MPPRRSNRDPADVASRSLTIEYVAPADLVRAEYNPRQMTADARARLRRSIAAHGFVDPIIARRGDRLVVGGHQRLHAARELGLERVPVVFLDDLDDQQAAALNVALNNPNAQGQWDMGRLTALLSSLDAHGYDATLTGFDEDELAKLLAGPLDAPEDEAPPAPSDPVTRIGDVYEMGAHRLVCGNALDPQALAAAGDGAPVGALVFDPPFEAADVIAAFDFAAVGAPDVFVFGDCMYDTHRRARVNQPWRFNFVWDGVTRWVVRGKPLVAHKTCDWFSATGAYDHDRFRDPRDIRTTAAKGTNPRGAYEIPPDPRGQSLASVFKSPVTAESHGAEHSKPVLWLALMLGNASQGRILDPFAGSGTSLLAAEQIGRPWGGVELNPAYCDVIVARWQAATGRRAVRRPVPDLTPPPAPADAPPPTPTRTRRRATV